MNSQILFLPDSEGVIIQIIKNTQSIKIKLYFEELEYNNLGQILLLLATKFESASMSLESIEGKVKK